MSAVELIEGARLAGDIRWHGSQRGVVSLSDKKLRIKKPRLRKRDVGGSGYKELWMLKAKLGNRVLLDTKEEVA